MEELINIVNYMIVKGCEETESGNYSFTTGEIAEQFNIPVQQITDMLPTIDQELSKRPSVADVEIIDDIIDIIFYGNYCNAIIDEEEDVTDPSTTTKYYVEIGDGTAGTYLAQTPWFDTLADAEETAKKLYNKIRRLSQKFEYIVDLHVYIMYAVVSDNGYEDIYLQKEINTTGRRKQHEYNTNY